MDHEIQPLQKIRVFLDSSYSSHNLSLYSVARFDPLCVGKFKLPLFVTPKISIFNAKAGYLRNGQQDAGKFHSSARGDPLWISSLDIWPRHVASRLAEAQWTRTVYEFCRRRLDLVGGAGSSRLHQPHALPDHRGCQGHLIIKFELACQSREFGTSLGG